MTKFDKLIEKLNPIKEAFLQEAPPAIKIDKKLNEKDIEFVHSLSAAVVQSGSKKLHWVISSFGITIFIFIIWAYFAKIDEIARGSGKAVSSGQNQVIQNLEGGIVSEILVKEGETVKKNQILIKISNEKGLSSAISSEIKADYFQAKINRIEAEIKGTNFDYTPTQSEELNEFLRNEKELFYTNKRQLESKVMIFNDQIRQKNSELADARQTISHSKFSLEAIDREVEMTRPMVERGIRSQVDFLKLQREQSDAKQRLQSAVLSVDRINSEISELKKKISEVYETNRAELRQQLNETYTQLKDTEVNKVAAKDQVDRTVVKSPSNGIVQKMYVNTIGGSIKPAQELLEIVPTDHKVIVEAKVLPKDIAFISIGQKAIVKFSAFDFSIYGGLDGHVVGISPDSITEKDEKTYYLVRIETDKNYIGNDKQKKYIIPGMVADADILTGKKSILDYILKPILKTKTYTFTER